MIGERVVFSMSAKQSTGKSAKQSAKCQQTGLCIYGERHGNRELNL